MPRPLRGLCSHCQPCCFEQARQHACQRERPLRGQCWRRGRDCRGNGFPKGGGFNATSASRPVLLLSALLLRASSAACLPTGAPAARAALAEREGLPWERLSQGGRLQRHVRFAACAPIVSPAASSKLGSMSANVSARCAGSVGGEGGIRTPVALASKAVFKTAAFDRSATSPKGFWSMGREGIR